MGNPSAPKKTLWKRDYDFLCVCKTPNTMKVLILTWSCLKVSETLRYNFNIEFSLLDLLWGSWCYRFLWYSLLLKAENKDSRKLGSRIQRFLFHHPGWNRLSQQGNIRLQLLRFYDKQFLGTSKENFATPLKQSSLVTVGKAYKK